MLHVYPQPRVQIKYLLPRSYPPPQPQEHDLYQLTFINSVVFGVVKQESYILTEHMIRNNLQTTRAVLCLTECSECIWTAGGMWDSSCRHHVLMHITSHNATLVTP